ncbi:MAG TPA: FliM/FliN family flagellar motor switch protein [Planctomycetota bacterium]|nr:FliM/FliN family flagellar motor switch protein [Planctomycetota bacterium]
MPEADKILSQHEVDALLSAIDSGAGDSAGAPPAEPYDFRRPSRIPSGPLRFVHALHESFAKALEPALSGMLLRPVDARLTGVHQLPLGEFLSSLPSPGVLILLSAEPLQGSFLMSIHPSIAGALVERMLGAGKPASAPRDRGFSPLEWKVADTLILRLLAVLAAAWAPVAPVRFHVISRESDPQAIKPESVNEPSVAVTLEVAMGDQRGALDLLFPALSIEPHFDRMAPPAAFSPKAGGADHGEELSRRLAPAEVEIGVHLPPATIRMKDLQTLRPGDYLVTSHPHADPVQVSVEGRLKFLARLGSLKDRKAAKIVASTSDAPTEPTGDLKVMPGGEAGPAAPGPSVREALLKLAVTATVVLAEKSVKLQEVMALKAGDVMEFGRSADDPLELRVSGRPIATGTAVRIGEQFGLKVISVGGRLAGPSSI